MDVRREVERLAADDGLDWPELSMAAADLLAAAVPHAASCWHTVDPGTVMLTGSTNRNVSCSATWLAHHEYEVEDVAKWQHLASSGRIADTTSAATHGDLSRSARHRSHVPYGFGDELRLALVVDGCYWGAVAMLRASDDPWFNEDERRFVARLSAVLAGGFRRAVLRPRVEDVPVHAGPGVLILDADGRVESVSPQAEAWLGELVEDPPPPSLVESRAVASVAARTRALGADPLGAAARARVRTRSGTWLLLYGTPLAGGDPGRVAVVLVTAPTSEVAPLVALAYGFTPRETEITRLCLQGLPTKSIARALGLSSYTVQDHLKSLFAKTGVHSRGELLGNVFLEHHVPRWQPLDDLAPGWVGWAEQPPGQVPGS